MDGFFVNLLLFVSGQLAAWHYLRTGRPAIGFAATVLLWGLLDAWLVARHAYRQEGAPWSWLLVGFQGVAVATVAMLVFGLWRRRWSRTARARGKWFGAGLQQYLRGELDAAAATFLRLVRCDPWDAAAWLALGNVRRAQGKNRDASRCYRTALRVDATGAYRDHANLQLGRVSQSRATPGRVSPGRASQDRTAAG